jgi:hypothetical protein
MRFRDRHDEEQQNHATSGSGDGAGDSLDAARREGLDFLAAGDAAIDRILSGDSERFLLSGRQHGGQ